ncbi:MAG: hypothetical protein C0594_02010 [Marinilabiliales bacterium]|nr:MAG: hypothetical protein C0594_02010 [Marinilabiliales bacterium]
MKKLTTLILIALSLVFIVSCNKEEEGDSPVLTLNGPSEDFCWTPGPYDDPGATASDTEDGDLTSQIEVNSDIDYSMPGINWSFLYSVKDSYGNEAGAQRVVKLVKMDGAYADNNWNNSTCDGGYGAFDTLTFNGHQSVTFTSFGHYENTPVEATIQGDTIITISEQSFNGITFSGSGTIEYNLNGSGNLIFMYMDVVKTDGSGTTNCTYNISKDGGV